MSDLSHTLAMARAGIGLLPSESEMLVKERDQLFMELVRVKALCKAAYAEGFMNGYLHVPNDTAMKSWEHSTTYRELHAAPEEDTP